MNIDILDEAPQFPGGAWVNHFIYGTLLGLCVWFSLYFFGISRHTSWVVAHAFVFFLCATKKVYDYSTRGPSQGQTILACVGKTFITWIGIFSLGGFFYL